MLRFIMLNHGSDLPCRKSMRTHFPVSLGWHQSISRRPCRIINLLTKANVPIVLDATRTLCRECGVCTRPKGERPSRIRSGSYSQLTALRNSYQAPKTIKTIMVKAPAQAIVAGTVRQTGVIVASRAVRHCTLCRSAQGILAGYALARIPAATDPARLEQFRPKL